MDFRGGAVKFLGTKRHHDKWLNSTENYDIKGCFAMSELGHGSNVCEGCPISWVIRSTCKLLCFCLVTFNNPFQTNFHRFEELKQSLLMIQTPGNLSSILHVNRVRSIGLVVQQM